MDENTEKIKSNKSATKQKYINDIIYTIKPVLNFERLFGILRFNVIDGNFVPTEQKYKLIAMILAFVHVAVLVTGMEFPSNFNDTPFLMHVTDQIPLVFAIIDYIVIVIMALFYLSDKTIEMFSSFVELDTTLCINMNENFYTRSRSITIKLLILLILVHVICTMADIVFHDDDFYNINDLLSMLLYLVLDLGLFIFCKMIYMSKNRLDVINGYLIKFVHEKDVNKTPIFTVSQKDIIQEKQFNFIGRVTQNNMKIRTLAAMYNNIGKICSLINEVFSFQIFMNLVGAFIYVVLSIWVSLYYFRNQGYDSGELVTVSIWCILTISSVAVTSVVCENLLTSRNTTKLLVNEIIMDYDLPRTMRVQAKVFMELIDAWPLRISVYDMFSIDITLVLKFVSVATTYLIVIIQISHFV